MYKNIPNNLTTSNNIDIEFDSDVIFDDLKGRPFNPNRIWKRNHTNISPHIFTVENGHFLPFRDAGKNNGNFQETLKQSNIFMDNYRKMLPREYKKGQIPLKKRKFQIDKDKSMNMQYLMKPKTGGNNDNLYHIPEKMTSVSQENKLQQEYKNDSPEQGQKRKFFKGYSIDSVYSLDRGFGYPKVGSKHFHSHELALKKKLRLNKYIQEGKPAPKIGKENVAAYFKRKHDFQDSMGMSHNPFGGSLTSRSDILNKNKFDYEIVGKAITEVRDPNIALTSFNKTSGSWVAQKKFFTSFNNYTNNDNLNPNGHKIFLNHGKDFIDSENNTVRNFVPKNLLQDDERGYKTQRDSQGMSMPYEANQIAQTNRHSHNHLFNLKNQTSYTSGFTDFDEKFGKNEDQISQNFGEMKKKGNKQEKFYSPKLQTKLLYSNPTMSNFRTNMINNSPFLAKNK